jgi:hypothetical protein
MPTATSEAERWETWQNTVVEEASVSFERPAGWVSQHAGPVREWAPVEESEIRLGFAWRPLAPDQDLRLLLPPEGEIVADSPLTLTWEGELSEGFSRAEKVTVQKGSGWEEHALLQLGLRAYDLYLKGPAPGSLATLEPVLARALDTIEIGDARLSLEDPLEAAIIWFQTALDRRDTSAPLTYMTPALRAQVPEGTSPLSLLALDQDLAVYDLSWLSGNPEEAVVEAAITLADESVVRRQLVLMRDPIAGWQVNTIIIPEGP